jgi:histidine triad (HIT) family protein
VHLIPLHDMDDMRFQRKVSLEKDEFENLAADIQKNL